MSMANKKFNVNRNFHEQRNYPLTFVPHIFKDNPTKPSLVCATDPFITEHSGNEYCSLFSLQEDKMPNYLKCFKEFTDNVLDIPVQILDDISKVHIEREWKFREEEEEEERRALQQHAVDLSEKSSMDKKVSKIMNSYKYYVKRSCPVKIPFKSTLTHEEHEFYVKSFIKFQIRRPVNALEESEYEQYLSMQNRVFDEQSCIMNFSYKVAQLVLNEYNKVPNVVENYIKEYVSHRCERATSYRGDYKGEIEIPLKPQVVKSSSESFQFTHLDHLLSLGWVPWINLPHTYRKTTLPKDESVCIKRRPDSDEDFDRNSYLYKCPISEDPNAEFLAKTHQASVVITPSALKTILDNQEQPFDKEWNVPIRIKSYKIEDENGKLVDHRIIYIDKPLPRKSWLPLQKKFTFFKASARGLLTRFLKYPYFRMKQPVQNRYSSPQKFAKYDNIFGSVTNYDSLDCFGDESPRIYGNKNKRKRFPSIDLESDLFLSEDDEDNTNKNIRRGAEIAPPSHYETNKRVSKTATQLPTPNVDKKLETPSTSSEKDEDNTDNNIRRGAEIAPPSHYETNNRVSKKATQLPTPNVDKKLETPSTSSEKDNPNLKDDTGLLDDLLNKQDSFLKLVSSPESAKKFNEVPSVLNNFNADNKEKKVFPKPWTRKTENKTAINWKDHKIKDCPEGGGTNVHYQLFSFDNMKECPVKEEKVKPVKILIRHNIHGLSRFKKEQKPSKAYVIFPKLENQVYFGSEVNSLSEIIQQWVDLLVRPNTHLLQIRLCIESGDVLMTEERNLESVLKEGKQPHLNFNPQTSFSTLNILINTLMKMSSGDYLLHHSPKTEAFMKLMKAVDDKEVLYSSHFDLHKFYSDNTVISRQYRSSPWLAIDTHILTPFHLFHKKIPATFPMENKRKLNRGERQKKRKIANQKLTIDGYE